MSAPWAPAGWTRRIGAGRSLLALLAAGTSAFLVADWRWLLALLVAALALHAAARIPLAAVLAQVRPALPVLGLVFVAQWLVVDWRAGLGVVLRFALLLVLAAFVTLTVPVSAMTRAMERGLRPLAVLGLRPARVALALSLAIRFLPLLAELAAAVREAQRARGRERNLVALAVPTIVQSLKMADDLAAAIEARGFDSES